MNEIVHSSPSSSSVLASPRAVPLPEPRTPIRVRVGTMADIPFIDGLMKKHSKQLAFLTRQTLEGKVKLGQVLVAEVDSCRLPVASEGNALTTNWQLSTGNSLAGYLIGNDRYQHRDELGVIYQLCVRPEYRRQLVAAHLLKAQLRNLRVRVQALLLLVRKTSSKATGSTNRWASCRSRSGPGERQEERGKWQEIRTRRRLLPLARCRSPHIVSTSSGRSGFAWATRRRRGGSRVKRVAD
ncbi:MAG: GNAT family N-acetyltransferase [Tepidisphaeraceae bacterium]